MSYQYDVTYVCACPRACLHCICKFDSLWWLAHPLIDSQLFVLPIFVMCVTLRVPVASNRLICVSYLNTHNWCKTNKQIWIHFIINNILSTSFFRLYLMHYLPTYVETCLFIDWKFRFVWFLNNQTHLSIVYFKFSWPRSRD